MKAISRCILRCTSLFLVCSECMSSSIHRIPLRRSVGIERVMYEILVFFMCMCACVRWMLKHDAGRKQGDAEVCQRKTPPGRRRVCCVNATAERIQRVQGSFVSNMIQMYDLET